MEFAHDGGGLAKGGLVTLYVDDGKVGEGRIQATVPMIYSGDETCDLGGDTGMPVSDDHASAAASSPARSNGCNSTPAPTTTPTSSPPEKSPPGERLRVATARR